MASSFLFFSYTLATIQPELFPAEVVTEQPPAEGSAVQRTMGDRVCPLVPCPLVPVTQSTKSTHSSHLTQQRPEETDKFSFSIYKSLKGSGYCDSRIEPFRAIVPTELNM